MSFYLYPKKPVSLWTFNYYSTDAYRSKYVLDCYIIGKVQHHTGPDKEYDNTLWILRLVAPQSIVQKKWTVTARRFKEEKTKGNFCLTEPSESTLQASFFNFSANVRGIQQSQCGAKFFTKVNPTTERFFVSFTFTPQVNCRGVLLSATCWTSRDRGCLSFSAPGSDSDLNCCIRLMVAYTKRVDWYRYPTLVV